MSEMKKHAYGGMMNEMVMDLPTPSNMNYWWNLGSLLGMSLMMQMMTGMMMGMHYSGDMAVAFDSVESMMSEVNSGWVMSYAHANGASLFFVMVYGHMGSALYYGSYKSPTTMVYTVGMMMFMLMMATAFMGYVLPWGQMSYWGATVMTSMFSAMPYMGKELVEWMWGGFAVMNPTLTSFYSLHYLCPFMMSGMVMLHLVALHEKGSNNPLGTNSNMDKMPFHPYYSYKDMYGGCMVLMMFFVYVYYYPNMLSHPDNYMEANSLVTPSHMVPEWYFLYAYAMLSAFPNKLGGVVALVGSMVVLFGTTGLHTSKMSTMEFSKVMVPMYWVFMSNFGLLTWLGGQPVEEPYMGLSFFCMVVYFGYLMVMTPVMGMVESKMVK